MICTKFRNSILPGRELVNHREEIRNEQTLYFLPHDDRSENRALGFTLKEAKVMDGGSVWLRYTVNP